MKKLILFISVFLCGLLPVSAAINDLNLHSNNIILYNIETDKIIYEQLSEEKVKIASLTKLFTAYFSIININDLEGKVILTKDMFHGLKEKQASVAGFKVGDKVTYRDLLYGVLLPSGADATLALAINLFGSEDNFAHEMTKYFNNLGLINTNLVNSSGLDDSNHYSSVKDILNLLLMALENKDFKTIFESHTYTTTSGLELKSTFQKYNEKLDFDFSYIKGSKTGFTNSSGVCLATYAINNNTSYLLITTGAQSYGSANTKHLEDAKTVYTYLFKNYNYEVLYDENNIVAKLPIIYSKNKNYLINLNNDFKYLKNFNNTYEIKYNGLNEINPLKNKNGSTIGQIEVYEDNKLIYVEDIILIGVNFSLLVFFQTHYIIIGITIILISFSLFILKKIHNR